MAAARARRWANLRRSTVFRVVRACRCLKPRRVLVKPVRVRVREVLCRAIRVRDMDNRVRVRCRLVRRAVLLKTVNIRFVVIVLFLCISNRRTRSLSVRGETDSKLIVRMALPIVRALVIEVGVIVVIAIAREVRAGGGALLVLGVVLRLFKTCAFSSASRTLVFSFSSIVC